MTDTVGAVYVRVLTDSGGFAKQLEKEAGRAGTKAGKKAGKKAADAFGKEWADDLNADLNKIQLDELLGGDIRRVGKDMAELTRLTRALGKDTKIDFDVSDVISPADLNRLSEQLKLPVEELAAYVKAHLTRAYADGFKALDRESEEAAKKEKKRLADQAKVYAKMQERRLQMIERVAKAEKSRSDRAAKAAAAAMERERKRIKPLTEVFDIPAFRDELTAMADLIHARLTPAIRDSLKEGGRVDWMDVDSAERSIRDFAQTYQISFSDAERAIRKQIQRTSKERDASMSWFAKSRAGFKGLFGDVERMDGRMKSLYRSMRRMGSGGFFDGLTTGIGGIILMSYKLGKAVAVPVTLIGKGFGRAVEAAGEALQTLSAHMGSAGRIAGKAGEGLASIGAGIASWAATGPAGAVALVAVLVILQSTMGAVAVLLSALTAGVVALGSALYYAVANAALLVPILGALGLGMAGLVIGGMDGAKAVMALNKAMSETDPKKKAAAMKQYREELAKLGPNARAAVEAFEPLIEGFKDLKKNAGEALFDGMAASIKKAKPLADAFNTGLIEISRAVGGVIKGFLGLAQNTAFMRDFNVMMKLSADIITDMGAVAVNVFSGLNSFFAAMEPVVSKFTDGLVIVSQEFETWAQSEGGRKAILDFFTTAYEIGGQVWAILKELGGALHDLFTADATQSAAKDFLTFILDKVTQFRDFINAAAADGRLKQWFDDAKEVAKGLWTIIGLLGMAFKSLLTPESMMALKMIGALMIFGVTQMLVAIHVIGMLGMAFTASFRVVKGAILAGWYALLLVKDAIVGIVAKFNALRASGKGVWDSIKGAIKGASDALRTFIDRIKSIKWPSPPSWFGKLTGNKTAAGGLFMGPTNRLIGEEGPEAVIPLYRPLARVDPSVRGMAAMMRGGSGGAAGSGGTVSSRQMTNYWTINSPSPDGRVVASQVVNRMAAMAG